MTEIALNQPPSLESPTAEKPHRAGWIGARLVALAVAAFGVSKVVPVLVLAVAYFLLGDYAAELPRLLGR